MRKKLISLIATLSSVALLFSAKVVQAEENVTIEYVTSKVSQAKQIKLIGVYNEAYAAILKLPADIQPNFLAELATVSKDVYTPDNLELLKRINDITSDPSLGDFTKLLNFIDINIKNEIDKGYFMGEMDSWGRKLVYTPEVLNAIKAVEKAWIDKTQQSVAAAQIAIAKVKIKGSREWLTGQLPQIDIKKPADNKIAKIVITQVDSIKYGESSIKFKYNILDQDGADITKKVSASDITAQPIVSYSKVSVLLDTETGIGTISGHFSDKDKIVGVLLMHKEASIVSQLMFNNTTTQGVKDITFGEIKLPNGLNKIEIKQSTAAIIPITALDGNGNIIKDENVLAEEFVITSTNIGAKAYFVSNSDGSLQLELNTSEMSEGATVIVSIINKTTGQVWVKNINVERP